MSKIFYQYELESDKLDRLASIMNNLEVKSVEELARNLGCRKNFVLPGTHDLLASIGESFCIRVSINSSSKENFSALIDSFVDYSMNLQRGVVKFFKYTNKMVNKICPNRLMEIVGELFKQKVTQAVLQSQQIDNILNLKTVVFLINFKIYF